MLVEIKGLSKTYPNGTKALVDVDLEIGSGMFGLLGPNGAGKTTLMRILATLLPPSAGEVTVAGKSLRADPQFVRENLGYLPQEFGLYGRFNAWEFLDYAGLLKGISDNRARRRAVEEVLHRVNLWEHRRRRLGGYSGGMKRRMGIAQALLGNPRLLIVDEPTAGLDPEERIRFRNLLAELSGDRVVLLSTHIVADVESSCYRLAILDRGKLRFAGSPAELIDGAQGKVWRAECNDAEARQLRQEGVVVSSRRTQKGFELKVISGEPPTENARNIEPTLEDGYMAIMSRNGIEVRE